MLGYRGCLQKQKRERCVPNVPGLSSLIEQKGILSFSYQLYITAHVRNIRSLVSDHCRRTIKPCQALYTRASKRLSTIKNAFPRPKMYYSKLALAVVISFAVASPVPPDNNVVLEKCNASCASEYTICLGTQESDIESGGWYVTQWILKSIVPLLTAHRAATRPLPPAK